MGILRLLDQLESMSRKHFIPSISRIDGAALASLAFQAPKGTILDLGAGIGYSTLWLAIGAQPHHRIIAVEYDQNLYTELEHYAEEITKATGIEIIPVKAEALEYLKTLPEKTIALAFIDIEKHQYPQALQELLPRLAPGATLAFHNAYTPRPPQKFFQLLNQHKVTYKIIPSESGLLIAKP